MAKQRGGHRRATPRLLMVFEWGVEHRPRWRRLRQDQPEDVVMLTMRGEWEHGQRQTVRAVFPRGEVEGLVDGLEGVDRTSEGDGEPPPVPVGATSNAGPPGVDVAGGPDGDAAAAASPPGPRPPSPPEAWSAMRAIVEQRLDRRCGKGKARTAFVSPWLRRHEAESLDDLPVDVLAAMANKLAEPRPTG